MSAPLADIGARHLGRSVTRYNEDRSATLAGVRIGRIVNEAAATAEDRWPCAGSSSTGSTRPTPAMSRVLDRHPRGVPLSGRLPRLQRHRLGAQANGFGWVDAGAYLHPDLPEDRSRHCVIASQWGVHRPPLRPRLQRRDCGDEPTTDLPRSARRATFPRRHPSASRSRVDPSRRDRAVGDERLRSPPRTRCTRARATSSSTSPENVNGGYSIQIDADSATASLTIRSTAPSLGSPPGHIVVPFDGLKGPGNPSTSAELR